MDGVREFVLGTLHEPSRLRVASSIYGTQQCSLVMQ